VTKEKKVLKYTEGKGRRKKINEKVRKKIMYNMGVKNFNNRSPWFTNEELENKRKEAER